MPGMVVSLYQMKRTASGVMLVVIAGRQEMIWLTAVAENLLLLTETMILAIYTTQLINMEPGDMVDVQNSICMEVSRNKVRCHGGGQFHEVFRCLTQRRKLYLSLSLKV